MDQDENSPLGKNIAFGVQQTAACWATDFIDPFIGKWFQNRAKNKERQATLTHTIGGEIIGDISAFFIFLAAVKWANKPFGWITQHIKSGIAPFYEPFARKNLLLAARKEKIDEHSEEFRRRLDQLEEFQAKNITQSALISLSSVAVNVMTQKAMGNSHSLGVITAGKLVGAGITSALVVGSRFALPQTMQDLDRKLDKHYISPLIEKTHTLLLTPEKKKSWRLREKNKRQKKKELSQGPAA